MALNFANNNSLSAITTLPASISGGDMTLLATQTASGSANISFTSGIDSTYDSYVFKFIDIHPGTDAKALQFNVSVDAGSNYNVAKTTTHFRAQHTENGAANVFEYVTADDLAQGTGAQNISNLCGSDNDQCVSGYLHLFNPSSTTFVKHFMSVVNSTFTDTDATANLFMAGYANTTSAVDAVQFKMSSGNIDSGVIKLYGIS